MKTLKDIAKGLDSIGKSKEADKPEHVEGEFTEMKGDEIPPQRSLEVVPPTSPQEIARWRPEFTEEAVDKAIKQVEEKRRFFDRVMKTGVHYAIIPGQRPTPRIDQRTGEQVVIGGVPQTDPPKPALLKPGAELLNAAMGLHPVVSREIVEEQRGDETFIEVHSTCRIYVQTGPGERDRMLVAEAGGSCNSFEEKYRYRGDTGRTCPSCGKVGTVRKGSKQFAPRTGRGGREGPVAPGFEQGGFYCWRKADGCGDTFPDADPRILSQSVEKKKNENPLDIKNTLEKMADKRALVAATLIATGCSDLFTQDIEEGKASPDAGRGEAGTATEEAPPPSDSHEALVNASQGRKAAPTTATQPTAPAAQGEIPDPSGWEYVMPFNRWRQEHAEHQANADFRHFFTTHKLENWADLKRRWGETCAEHNLTFKDEILTIIGTVNTAAKPAAKSFDPDALKTDLNP